LDPIREVIAAPDLETRNAVITAHLERLETALGHTLRAAESLRGVLTGTGPPSARIEQIQIPATAAAAVTATIMTDHDTTAWLLGALAELHATLQAQGLQTTGPAGEIFSDELFTEARGEATVFVPRTDRLQPIGRINPVIVPAAELATIVHLGTHTEIDRSYGALATCRRARARDPGAAMGVLPHRPRQHPDQAEWRTRIGGAPPLTGGLSPPPHRPRESAIR
jgi:hypothetical protein